MDAITKEAKVGQMLLNLVTSLNSDKNISSELGIIYEYILCLLRRKVVYLSTPVHGVSVTSVD